MPVQSSFDILVNDGNSYSKQRKVVQNNPGDIPMGLIPSDFGLIGWSIDPADVSTVTQAVVSGTQYFTLLSNQTNLNAANGNAVAKVGLHLGTTAPVTPGTYSGFALYSYVPGATTMAKLGDTGADNGAAWVTSGASNYMEGTLGSAVSSAPGLIYASFIATFTTPPTVYAETLTANTFKFKGKSVSLSYSLAAQTSFAATVTVSGLTAGTFRPFMGIASS
jgi:hypothetical protein